ncbi:MAG: hypothetical protein U1C47_17745, partial [Hydrogenophaga sp.]|nr:hypothetical protein [Hydrogenophaga sp.]
KYVCPKCQGTDLGVCVLADAKLIQTDDNVETVVDGGGHTWDETHNMWCNACGFCAGAGSFWKAESAA